jgi:hypothetical protein
VTWTVTDVPGFWAVMTWFLEKALAIRFKPLNVRNVASTKITALVLNFMIFSSVLSFFVSMLTSV